jgi:hypothetical protein
MAFGRDSAPWPTAESRDKRSHGRQAMELHKLTITIAYLIGICIANIIPHPALRVSGWTSRHPKKYLPGMHIIPPLDAKKMKKFLTK